MELNIKGYGLWTDYWTKINIVIGYLWSTVQLCRPVKMGTLQREVINNAYIVLSNFLLLLLCIISSLPAMSTGLTCDRLQCII